MSLNRRIPHLRRALLHPVWLGAVATLILNDHVLKGSGFLPGWVTGKLSDVVGLFAAPLLLAVLTRVSSRRGWALAHVAIGAVFGAIQVSTAAADTWSALMGTVGFPWAITSDPTDLLTLPVLAVSFTWVPKLAQHHTTQSRTGELAVASAGLVACVATSQDPGDPFYSSFETDTYIHNANPYDIVVRMRPLAETSIIDCDVAEEDPAGYLREALFADAASWTLAPDATMPVVEFWEREFQPCYAVWIDVDNLPPSIVFWRDGQFSVDFVDGTGITPETRGWISIAYDDEGRGRYETEEELVFPIESLPRPDEASTCTPGGPETRLAWGSIPTGEWRLGAAVEGPDGCLSIDLRTGFEDELDQPGRSWEACLPRGSFPFEAGDLLKTRALGLGQGNDAIEILRLDPLTGEAGTGLVAWKGNGQGTVFGVQPLVDPNSDCQAVAEDTCGTVRQVASVSVAGGGFETTTLSTEASVRVQSDTEILELHLVHASQRLIANTACGDQDIGNDIELVAIRRDRGAE